MRIKKNILLAIIAVLTLMISACIKDVQVETLSGKETPEVVVNEQIEKENKHVASLNLNNLDQYEDALNEEIEWNEEMLLESDSWKAAARELDSTEYKWISEAKELIVRYFADIFQEDISENIASIKTYSTEMAEILGGFSDGTGNVYFNKDVLESKNLLSICIHEMIHALGVDFYQDKSGIMSNAFFEGYTEAVTGRILTEYGYSHDDISVYNELVKYAQVILDCDPQLLTDIIINKQYDIASRIDNALGDGMGESLLKAEMLIESGETNEIILENTATIVNAYKEAMGYAE